MNNFFIKIRKIVYLCFNSSSSTTTTNNNNNDKKVTLSGLS